MKAGREERIIRSLAEAESLGKLSHAYILDGGTPEGRRELAEYIASSLLCDRKPGLEKGACGLCPACAKTGSGNHPDIVWVSHDEKKGVIKVDTVRDEVVEDVSVKPYYGMYKIYIFEDAEQMNPNSQNALLKTLEEPPAYALILLLTANADILLDTIRSRCIRMGLARVMDTEDEDELKMAETFGAVAGMNAAEIFTQALGVPKNDGTRMTECARKWVRDIMVTKTGGGMRLYFSSMARKMNEMAGRLSYENINNMLIAIDKAEKRLEANVKQEAVLEMLLLAIRKNTKEVN